MYKTIQPPCGRGKCNPPLVAGATTFPPLRGGTITRAYCRAAYEESVSRCFILPPEQGEVRRSRIGGGERSEPIRRMLIIPYDTESKSRNADFKNCGAAATTILSGGAAVAPRAKRTQPAADRRPQPSARRAVNLSLHNPYTQPAAEPRPLFIICGEAATTTL